MENNSNVLLVIIVISIVTLFGMTACEALNSKKELARKEKMTINNIEHYTKTACIGGVTYLWKYSSHGTAITVQFGADSKIIPCKPQTQYPINYQ